MKVFVLLLTLWGEDIPEVYVIDFNMTGEDCISTLSIEYDKRVAMELGGILSCEIDEGH